MAATETGALLTRAHAASQVQLSRQTMAEALQVFDLLDVEDLDGSEARWLRAMTDLVTRRYAISQEAALRYLLAFRGVELGGTLAPVLAQPLVAEQVVTSLRVVGPYTVKRLVAEGLAPDKAKSVALTRTLGAASRLAQSGGRRALDTNIQADSRALGYQRVTASGACAFCALLAGRGPVYKTERSAGEGHRYHDHCHCQVEPVYNRSSAMPESSAAYRAAYEQAEGGTLQEKLASMRQILGTSH